MITNLALRTFIAASRCVARTHDEDGQTLAEYSLLVSLIGVATVITGVIVFRDAVAGAFNTMAGCLDGSC